jgi:hypothetical protein
LAKAKSQIELYVDIFKPLVISKLEKNGYRVMKDREIEETLENQSKVY